MTKEGKNLTVKEHIHIAQIQKNHKKKERISHRQVIHKCKIEHCLIFVILLKKCKFAKARITLKSLIIQLERLLLVVQGL